MGRVFSLLLLGSMALIPVSQVLAGAFLSVNLDATMIGAGLAMAAVSLVSALSPHVRGMGLEPLAARSEA